MKKLMFVCVMLVALLLVGCGSPEGKSDSTSNPSGPTVKNAETLEITPMYGSLPPSKELTKFSFDNQDDIAAFKDWVNKFVLEPTADPGEYYGGGAIECRLLDEEGEIGSFLIIDHGAHGRYLTAIHSIIEPEQTSESGYYLISNWDEVYEDYKNLLPKGVKLSVELEERQ